MEIKQSLVVGAGVMGHSIAQVFAQAGIETDMVDLDEKALERGHKQIASNLKTLAEFGRVDPDEIPAIVERVHPSTDLAASARKADFAIEAVPELPEAKKNIFAKLDEFCPPDIILASNTSGLDIFSLAEGVKRPERLVIAHWYTPAHIVPLVEVAPGPKTAPEIPGQTAELMERLGKKPVVMKKFAPGFIVNQIQNAIGLTMFDMLSQGLADPEEIDRAIKYSLGVRMPIVGIVQNTDFNGLDLVQHIFQRLQVTVPLIDEMVSQGRLGVKTSKGIYDYGGRSEEEILKKRDGLFLKMLDHLESIKAFDPV